MCAGPREARLPRCMSPRCATIAKSPGFEILGGRTHIYPAMMTMTFHLRETRRWAMTLVLAGSLLVGPAWAAQPRHPVPMTHVAMAPTAQPWRQSLMDLLNTPPARRRPPPGQVAGALSSLGQALVLKPDLGACQSFVHGCHEGAIVTMPHNDVMQTMGAGLGMRVGGVRFEYAYGLHTGANFLGIRTRIP